MKDREDQRQRKQKKEEYTIFGSNFFAFIFGTWLSALLQIGSQKMLDPQMIPQLDQKDKIWINYTTFLEIFYKQSKQQRSSIQGFTLIKIILSFYQKQLILLLIICIITIAGNVFIPLFSREVIDYVDKPEGQTMSQKIYYFIEFVVIYSIFITNTNLFYFVNNVKGVNLANMLSLMVYQKALKYPMLAMKNFESSEIINYSQMDARRFQSVSLAIKQLFCFIVQTLINLVLICKVVGFLSFFIGVTMLLIFFGISYVLFYFLTQLSEQLGEAKDNTVKAAEQILDLMKLIKSSGLQKYFLDKISKNRQAQIQILSKLSMIKALSKFLSSVTSPAIIFVILLLEILLGNNISPGDTFFIIMIFSNIQGQLDFIPINLSLFTLLLSSTVRIEAFLFAEEIDSLIVEQVSHKGSNEFAIQIVNGDFLWENFSESNDEESQHPSHKSENGENSIQKQKFQQILIEDRRYTRIFHNLNLKLRSKCLTMLIGQIGSGKSSIINCILNEMISQPDKNSKIKINGSIAYCPQKPWIMSGNLKDNIIFFEEYDQERLDKAIYFSCLTEDLKILKSGLETQIGQKGINLSGGQKARVSLARALYMNKDIYIFDDILSALDVNVSSFIVKNTLKGYIKDKTIIMATHATNFLDKADNLIIINKGEINYMQGQQCKQYTNKVLNRETQAENRQKKVILKDNQRVKQNTVLDKPMIEEQQNKIINELMIPQEQLEDDTGLVVYIQYLKLNGGKFFIVSILVVLLVWLVLNILSNIQVQQLQSNSHKENYLTQLYLYIVFAIQYSFVIGLGSLCFSSGEVQSGRQIHKQVMKSLIYADYIQFHNRVPKGRILNRLSNDLDQMDEGSYELEAFIMGVFSIIATFCIGAYSSSLLAVIPILIVLILIVLLFRYNIKSQQWIIRLEKMALSPITSGITEIISGVDTIRSYNMSEKFISSQIQKTDYYQRMAFTRIAIQEWLLFRVSFASLIFNYSIFAYCLFFRGKSSQIGLFLTFSMNFLHEVSELLYIFIQYKNMMVSAERLMNLRQLEPEEGYKHSEQSNLSFYEQKSPVALNFVNYSARYRSSLPNSLNNINLAIQTGATVGIVGRTGAGKTTLINCILRFLQPSEGSLLINGRQIRDYDIQLLRSSMTIIDQESLLINGTIRENLDPANQKSDSEILEILTKCNFERTVKQKGGLYSYISNNSLSAGEKQMICICRALLKECSIVLIDEATANIDIQNDRLLHEVIKTEFKQKTILIIAHRLTTLKDCDKILVLEQGKVIQWGSTIQLLNKEDSIYRRMWETHDQSYLY